MKKILFVGNLAIGALFLIITFLFNQTLYASEVQVCDTVPKDLFPQLEADARFESGSDGWKLFLMKNIKADVAQKNGAPPGSYNVFARFIINKTGDIDTVLILKDPGYGMGEELARVIKLSSGKWYPAVQKGGEKLRSMRGQPFTFEVKKD